MAGASSIASTTLGAVAGEVAHLVAGVALDVVQVLLFGTVLGEVAQLLAVTAGDILGVRVLGAFLGHVSLYFDISKCVVEIS